MGKILVNRKESNKFTQVPNQCLRDNRVSEKAKGIYAIIYSLPPTWDFSISGLVTICNGKESSVRSAMKELKEFGYCEITKVRDDLGRIKKVEYEIFESSTYPLAGSQNMETPLVETPLVENPHVDNQVQYNKDIINKDLINKEELKKEKVKKEKVKPTSDEVADYFESNGYPIELGIKAFNHYDRLNWQDSNGNKVKNWKNKCKSVWMARHDEQQGQKQIKPQAKTVKYIRYLNGNGVEKVDPENIFEQRLGAYPFLIDNIIEKFEKEERIV